jgi:hypothetical protein
VRVSGETVRLAGFSRVSKQDLTRPRRTDQSGVLAPPERTLRGAPCSVNTCYQPHSTVMMLKLKIVPSASSAIGRMRGRVSTEREGYIENGPAQVQYSAVWPLLHRLISQSQTFVAVKGQQSRDQFIHITRHDAIKLVDR